MALSDLKMEAEFVLGTSIQNLLSQQNVQGDFVLVPKADLYDIVQDLQTLARRAEEELRNA